MKNGEILAYVHANNEELGKIAIDNLNKTYEIKENLRQRNPDIIEIIA